jgi:hypothetical protein
MSNTYKSLDYKYKIKHFKGKLPYNEVKAYNKIMHEKLGIGKSTLKKYEDLRINDKCEIPASILIQLAKFFNVEPEKILQRKIKPIRLEDASNTK